MRAAKGSGLERRRETPHFAGRVDGGEARQAPHHRPEQFLGLRPPHRLGAAAGECQAEQLERAQPNRGVGCLRVGHCAEQQPVGERRVERRARVVGEREDGLGGSGALAREQPRECAPSEPRGRLLAVSLDRRRGDEVCVCVGGGGSSPAPRADRRSCALIARESCAPAAPPSSSSLSSSGETTPEVPPEPEVLPRPPAPAVSSRTPAHTRRAMQSRQPA